MGRPKGAKSKTPEQRIADKALHDATKKPTGKPRKYQTAEDFARAVDNFIAYCEDTDTVATDYQLCKYCDISVTTLDAYRNERDYSLYRSKNSDNKGTIGDNVATGDSTDSNVNNSVVEDTEDTDEKYTYKGYAKPLKKLAQYREDQAIREARSNPKLVGHIAMRLKQKNWGGWVDSANDNDRPTKLEIDLKIKSNGVDVAG